MKLLRLPIVKRKHKMYNVSLVNCNDCVFSKKHWIWFSVKDWKSGRYVSAREWGLICLEKKLRGIKNFQIFNEVKRCKRFVHKKSKPLNSYK